MKELLKIIELAYRRGVVDTMSMQDWTCLTNSKQRAQEIFNTYIKWNSTMKKLCNSSTKDAGKSNKTNGIKKTKKLKKK